MHTYTHTVTDIGIQAYCIYLANSVSLERDKARVPADVLGEAWERSSGILNC